MIVNVNPTYHIIFRTCDVIQSLHNTPRPFGLDKRSLIKICFKSLIRSLEGMSYTITIVGDRLSEELIEFFTNYQVTLVQGEFGNDQSLRKCIEIAMILPENDWVYFVEDDYLHTHEAFSWINDLIVNRDQYISKKALARRLRFWKRRLDKTPIIIHTPDYPDRYLPKYLRFSMIFVSRYCHWRQITNTTFTFLLRGSSLRKYSKILFMSCAGANDGYLSRALFGGFFFWRKALCLSPIPGVSTHMHDGVMTPLVDWEKYVKEFSD